MQNVQKRTQQKQKNNKVKEKKKFDFVLFITVLILLSLGLIMVLSASAPSALSESGDSYTYFRKQFIFAIIGIIAMMIISKIDYRRYKKWYWISYFVSVGILLLVLVPGLRVKSNGAVRWISLGGLGTFQPSELTKIGLILFYAGYLTDHKDQLKDFWRGFIKPLIFLAPPIAILILVQNHMSASIIIATVSVTMMLMAGVRLINFIFAGIVAAFAGGVYFIQGNLNGSNSFRWQRIQVYFNPWSDARGKGYQMIQSLYAIGSGGLFGVGLGQSTQKYLYIPEPENDFIFAILAEELGFVGCAIVIALFGIFIWRGIITAMKAPDMFGSLLAIGITTLIGLQAIINIAVVTASIPTTGISLPFFSYGGTSLLITLASVGVLLNISKSSSKV